MWCTIVVLLGTAHATTNEPLAADTPAGTKRETGAGSFQALAGDPFLAAQSALASTVYVDSCAPGSGDGSVANPYNTLGAAVTAASPGDTIVMQGGSYPETLDIPKALSITSSGGPTLVGEYFVGVREVSVPVTVCPDCGGSLPYYANAIVYYPSDSPGGTQIACGGPFPAVVYAHGRRSGDWNLCSGWSDPGDPSQDYRQAQGILTRLASSGIIAISVDHDWAHSAATFPAAKGAVVINTIAYLRDEHQASGSWLEGAVLLNFVGLSGHSTGGAAATFAALNINEPPYNTLNLSPAVQIKGLGLIAPACPYWRLPSQPCFEADPPEVPMLVVHGTRDHCQVFDDAVDSYIEASAPKHLVMVTGANHFGYTDGICLEPVEDCDDGWDFSSEVGGVTGPEAHARQQRTARNYLRAFFSYYLDLPGKAGAIDYLLQETGQSCSGPVDPSTCGPAKRLFDDLQDLNVEVRVCSCQ